MLKIQGFACGFLLASSCLAQAQVVEAPAGTTTVTTETVATPAPAGEMRRVSQLLGSTVQLQGVNNYGKVEDIVLDPNGGVSYLVVNNGGRLAMMPYQAANVNYTQRVVRYDVTPQAVQPLLFAPTAFPRTLDPQFTNRVYQVFPSARAARRGAVPATVIVPGAVPPPAPVVVPVAPEGAVILPGEAPVTETVKIKQRRNGTEKVIIRER